MTGFKMGDLRAMYNSIPTDTHVSSSVLPVRSQNVKAPFLNFQKALHVQLFSVTCWKHAGSIMLEVKVITAGLKKRDYQQPRNVLIIARPLYLQNA